MFISFTFVSLLFLGRSKRYSRIYATVLYAPLVFESAYETCKPARISCVSTSARRECAEGRKISRPETGPRRITAIDETRRRSVFFE